MPTKDKFFTKKSSNYIYGERENSNIIASDTDSIYISLGKLFNKNSNKSEIIETADEIAKTINKEFPAFVESVFNVPHTRNDIIKTELEVVSKRSFFFFFFRKEDVCDGCFSF